MVYSSNDKKAYLVLSDGTVFEGKRFGAERDSIGELVFTTGMGAYVETLTDPCFSGQIVMQTFPLNGNYGIQDEDVKNPCVLNGYVVRDYCRTPSNFRCDRDINTFLKDNDIPGLYGIDTRELTRKIRTNGVMNAAICSNIPENLAGIENFSVKDVVKKISCKEEHIIPAFGKTKYRVALLDMGVREEFIEKLIKRGCDVKVFPCSVKAAEVLEQNPDGVVISDGPGNPLDNSDIVVEIKKMINKAPMIGIGLGHQLMALAFGGRVYKLKYGHRGANQPVKDVSTNEKGRSYITTQNHGYAVDGKSIKEVGNEIFRNLNDGTCEGIKYDGLNCISFQFEPEAHKGFQDTAYLLDGFIKMMEGEKDA